MAFAGVPGFWSIASSRPLEEILVTPQVAEFHQMGLQYLRLTPLESTSARRIREFREALMRNRQASGLFASKTGEIAFLGNRLFRTDLWIPANAPIGTYTVSVFLVRDGEVVSAETTPLVVGKVGFEARVSDFAHRYAPFYGILAVARSPAVAGWIGQPRLPEGLIGDHRRRRGTDGLGEAAEAAKAAPAARSCVSSTRPKNCTRRCATPAGGPAAPAAGWRCSTSSSRSSTSTGWRSAT